MTSTWQINPVGKGRFLPDDLSLYIGKKTLVKLVLEAMEEINARNAEREGRESHSVAFQSAMMLTLLTYCYATGVYGSVDIQLAMQRDQMIRYLCARNYPDICATRSFRRYHREKIAQYLSAVLQRVWELRFCGEDAKPIRSDSYFGSSLARWIDVKSTPDFKREAEERITQAVRADSMSADL